jgi:hypothetical protein
MQTISVQTVGSLRREFRKRGSSSHLREIIAKFRKAIEIPAGYQDETGFHFGVERAEKEGR